MNVKIDIMGNTGVTDTERPNEMATITAMPSARE